MKKGLQNSFSFSFAPHILSFKNFTKENLGSYVCRTKNKNGLLVELEVKIELDEFNNQLAIKKNGETVLNDTELNAHKKSNIPNIRISFSDKQALANGERVEILCDSGNLI